MENKDRNPQLHPERDPAGRGKKPGAHITELETEIMQVVWAHGSVTAAEVREALFAHRPLAHTTILTVLDKLQKKKVVRVVPSIGRAKKFRAIVEKGTVASRLLNNLRGRYFGGSAASLVAHLVKDSALDEKELEEIRQILEKPRA